MDIQHHLQVHVNAWKKTSRLLVVTKIVYALSCKSLLRLVCAVSSY